MLNNKKAKKIMDKVMKMDDPMKDTMAVLIDTVDELKMNS